MSMLSVKMIPISATENVEKAKTSAKKSKIPYSNDQIQATKRAATFHNLNFQSQNKRCTIVQTLDRPWMP